MKMLCFIRLQSRILISLKRLASYFTFLMCILLFPAHAFAFDDVGIEVTGQGSVVAIPDQFSLTMTITERGRVPSKLKSLVDKKSNSVIHAAKNLAVKDRNISSARVNLRIVEEKPSIQVQGIELHKARQTSVYIDGQSINQHANNLSNPKKTLFELSRQVTVKFNKIDDYDRFLAQIIKINVSRISALSMHVSERDEYYQQALLQAVSHGKQKAQRMAKQAGRNLGKLLLVKELSSNHYRPIYAEAMMSDSSANRHQSQIGSQTITARVLVKFDLAD